MENEEKDKEIVQSDVANDLSIWKKRDSFEKIWKKRDSSSMIQNTNQIITFYSTFTVKTGGGGTHRCPHYNKQLLWIDKDGESKQCDNDKTLSPNDHHLTIINNCYREI